MLNYLPFWKYTHLNFQSLNHSTSTIDQLEQTEGGKCQIGSLNWVFSVATMTVTLKISDVAKINTHYKFAQKFTKNDHTRCNKGIATIFGKIKLLFSRLSFCALQRLHFVCMYVCKMLQHCLKFLLKYANDFHAFLPYAHIVSSISICFEKGI